MPHQEIQESMYSVPRNPLFESMTIEEVLRSGLWQFGDIREMHRVKAWQGATITPGEHGVTGSLYWYNSGMLFLSDSGLQQPEVAEVALRQPKMILKGETLSLREYVGILAGRSAGGDTLSKLEHAVKAPRFFSELKNPATFAIPYLELVEAEDRMVKKLLGKVRYAILTCQSADGARRSFMFEDLTTNRVGIAAFQMRENRLQNEMVRVISLVKWALVDMDELSKQEEQFRAEYGTDWTPHAPQIIQKLIEARDQQLQQMGYSLEKSGSTDLPLDRRLAAAVLERFGDTARAFLQIPVQLNIWLETLQEIAQGKPQAAGN